jgi:hypothetical protein
MKELKQFSTGKKVALGSAILLGLAAFLPWGTALGLISISGMEGDGKITIGIAVIAIVLLLIKKVPVWIVTILGILATVIGVVDYSSMSDVTNEISASVGIGIYLTVAAGAGMIVGTIMEMVASKKKNPSSESGSNPEEPKEEPKEE